mmetsp:Transcript_19308/g.26700  ORF Transcript_19308/g.26700 Transcript_19308/m.26700 type:complete len:797 (-) Transcript_19308:227-2617(-)|eukprot:CAMPEP_0196584490 /NCGR_PEP_ID=MMETSP1081-20130531/47198_1 /TAXON_ID=36882 /ORGANISM="Pyramimonas amylifera, Strain CCMP720" /LENGTH=796 /DNA_ID=CAMNT_0041905705 /DNA_START=29 /DNA_END=2419 /DNA_ORIENTATION=-
MKLEADEGLSALEMACKGRPVQVFEIPKRGKGLFVTKSLSCGDTVFVEAPYASLQAAESKAEVVACGACHRPLGPLGAALCLQAGVCSRAQVTQHKAPDLPLGSESEVGSWGISCRLGCGEMFCSPTCETRAQGPGGHSRLCVGPLDTDTHPLYQFKMYALQTYQEFLMAAQIIASIIYQCENLDGAIPKDANITTPLERGQQTLDHFKGLFGGAVGGRCWWEVCAIPPEEQHVAQAYRQLVESQAVRGWQLLVAGLSAPPSSASQTPLPALPPDLLSLNTWGCLLTSLELCCQRLSSPSPLSDYFQSLLTAPLETREAVLSEVRPFVKQIEVRMEEEDDDDEDEDDEQDDDEEEEDEDEEEEDEDKEEEKEKEVEHKTSAADDLESLVQRAGSLFSGPEVIGLYPLVSSINHSCHPNCVLELHPGEGEEGELRVVLKVLRTSLPAGAELTFSYIEGEGTRAERHAALQPYSFNCECSRCVFEKRLEEYEGSSVQERGERMMREVCALGDLALKEERYKDALTAFQWVIGHNPKDGDAIHGIGVVRLNEEQWSKAHRVWREGAIEVPNHPELAAQAAKQASYYSGKGRVYTGKHFDTQADFEAFVVPPTAVSSSHSKEEMCVYKNRGPVFSHAECAAVIQEAEAAAQGGRWTTSRHYSVPTTDLPLHSLPRSLAWFNSALQTTLGPMLATLYPSKVKSPDWVRVHDAFVVKYDSAAQKGLPLHSDQSEYSMTIALNSLSEYEGGGTYFEEIGLSVRPDIGEASSFPGFLYHQGNDITSGYRYIIAVFFFIDRSGLE